VRSTGDSNITIDVRLRSGFQIQSLQRSRRTTPAVINFQKLNLNKLTWLALDEDQAARSRKVEQLIAL